MEQLNSIFRDIPADHYDPDLIRNSPIIIYGAGYCGTLFCELAHRMGLSPVCFFDRSEAKAGSSFMGTPVCQPKIFCNAQKYTVVVCMFEKGKLFQQIHDMLVGMGYIRVVHIYELRNDKKLFAAQNLIISPDVPLLKDNLKKITEVYHTFSDNASKETYSGIMKFLVRDFDTAIPALPIREQYFAYDIYRKNRDEVFVDCGAFKGGVMDIFLQNNDFEFKEYHAIEPDRKYVKILEQKKAKYHDEKIMIHSFAVNDVSGTLRIRNYGNENSVAVPDGEQSVDCFPLDNFLCKVTPTFIKIDVEGFEQQVLSGAKNIISSCKPLLAIAVYHREKDLWEIPLMLKKNYPFYSLFLRSYLNVQETVLYAVPESRKAAVKNEIH